jgi:hypothetical protein
MSKLRSRPYNRAESARIVKVNKDLTLGTRQPIAYRKGGDLNYEET